MPGSTGDAPTRAVHWPRRRVLGALSGGAALLAGCSGGSQGGPDVRTGSEVVLVGDSTVEGIEIESIANEGGGDRRVSVSATVRNTGEQTVDVYNYEWVLSAFDGDGNDISDGETGFGTDEGATVGAGETMAVFANRIINGSKEDMARLKLGVRCTEGNGKYCDG
jgi:hypothetical protein